MNPQEINKRIAIACGWKHEGKTYSHGRICDTWGSPDGDFFRSFPNYHGDLNAMHEAEATFSDVISIKSYCHHLTSQVHPEYATEHLVRCSAADKAEAFLRTIGQWEDGE